MLAAGCGGRAELHLCTCQPAQEPLNYLLFTCVAHTQHEEQNKSSTGFWAVGKCISAIPIKNKRLTGICQYGILLCFPPLPSPSPLSWYSDRPVSRISFRLLTGLPSTLDSTQRACHPFH